MSVKNGDFVINYCDSEGVICIGKVFNLEGVEHDLEFFHGGTVSPVGTEDSIVVPERLARMLDKIIDQVPTDENGDFIFSGSDS